MVTEVTPDEDPMGVWPTVQRAMDAANTNPETGLRYGIIAANSLDPEVVAEIQQKGKDLHWEAAKEELRNAIIAACDDVMSVSAACDVADYAVERASDCWEQDEPVHSFELQGVKGQTTWLGGALMVYVFHSPFQTKANLCSPCVPNCGNLDSLNPGGYDCYDVPSDWRYTP